MKILVPIRKMKHLGLVLYKRYQRYRFSAREARYRKLSVRVPFKYERNSYIIPPESGANMMHADSTFPVNHILFESSIPYTKSPIDAPNRLFLVWTGENALTDNRKRSIETLRNSNPNLDVVLVHPGNLLDWVVDSHPIHNSYQNLSFVHRADYLRAYLMHHHGGIYADIKPFRGDLAHLVDLVNQNSEVWGGGMPEIGAANVGAAVGGRLGEQQRMYFSRVPAASCHAFKPASRLTAEWLSEVERRMDYFSSLLSDHPAVDANGILNCYPVPWYTLLGNIFGPLCLKYIDRLIVDPDLAWPTSVRGGENYR